MAKYDVERLYSDIESLLKSELNNKLLEIDTEKADIVLDPVDDNAYFFQTMTENAENYDPFLFYGEDQVIATGTGPATVETFSIDIGIILQIKNDPTTGTRLLRYRRALREIFEKNWVKINRNVKLKVTSLAPWPLPDLDTDTLSVGIGVTLEASLA